MTSKEMLEIKEALERIANNFGEYEVGSRYYDLEFNKDIQTIKQGIERLEKIENLRTTPNALETILANYMNKFIDLEKENQKLKEQYTDLSNKEQLMTAYYKDYKKALEVINNKYVDIFILQYSFTLSDYNSHFLEIWQLTQEEFELLNNVLENEKSNKVLEIKEAFEKMLFDFIKER